MIDVTCAIIRNEESRILIVQRGEKTDHPLKWEFPGGKINAGEGMDECIIREIDEELSMNIVICGRLDPVEYDYGYKQIRLFPFICDTLDELPFLSEHAAYKWIRSEEMKSVDFCEADILVAEEFLLTVVPCSKQEIQPEQFPSTSTADDIDLQSMINNIMGKQEAEWIATSAIENSALFNKLIEFSFSPDKKLAFRSSWTITKVCDRYPELIKPFLPGIIESLSKIENESAQRSFLRILSLVDVPAFGSNNHGILADHCFNTLKSGFSSIAVKAYSMEILFRLSLIYPDLIPELTASIKILLEDASAGIASKGRNILKKLGEMPLNDDKK